MNTKASKYLPFLLALAIFMQMLDATILNTALPKMALDLDESPLNMQSAIISYALTLALLMPLSGYLSDRFGTKKVFLTATLLFMLGSFFCALSFNLTFLVISRIIQAVGGAMLMPLPRMILLRAYERKEVLNVMNFIIMPALIGPVLGPLVGGYLVVYASWHWIFLINIPIGFLILFFSLKIFPDFKSPLSKEELKFDSRGFFIFALGAVSLSLAVEFLTRNDMKFISILAFLIGFGAVLSYYRYAKGNKNAIYSLELFKVRTYRLGMLGNFFSRLGMSSLPYLLPLLLQVAFLHSPTVSGWSLAPIALAALLSKPFIRPLIKTFGYKNILIWNTRLVGLLIMSLSLLKITTPFYILIPSLLMIGVLNSIQYASMNTLSIAKLRDYQSGSANSLLAVNQQLAVSFGIAFGALILNFFLHDGQSTESIHQAFTYTFVIIGSVTFLSSFVFKKLHIKDGNNMF